MTPRAQLDTTARRAESRPRRLPRRPPRLVVNALTSLRSNTPDRRLREGRAGPRPPAALAPRPHRACASPSQPGSGQITDRPKEAAAAVGPLLNKTITDPSLLSGINAILADSLRLTSTRSRAAQQSIIDAEEKQTIDGWSLTTPLSLDNVMRQGEFDLPPHGTPWAGFSSKMASSTKPSLTASPAHRSLARPARMSTSSPPLLPPWTSPPPMQSSENPSRRSKRFTLRHPTAAWVSPPSESSFSPGRQNRRHIEVQPSSPSSSTRQLKDALTRFSQIPTSTPTFLQSAQLAAGPIPGLCHLQQRILRDLSLIPVSVLASPVARATYLPSDRPASPAPTQIAPNSLSSPFTI